MPPVPDLVRDSKLETIFYEKYTQHIYHVSGANPRQRKVRKEECWERCGNLGTGTFGTVWLEKLIVDNSEEKYRAVKEIRKGMQQSSAIDYSRELEAIAKFSHQKVRESSISACHLLVHFPSLIDHWKLTKNSMICAL